MRTREESNGSSSASGGSAERGECRPRERLAEHGRVLDHPALLCAEPVKPRGDQRVQRLGHLERLDRPHRPVDGPPPERGRRGRAAFARSPRRTAGSPSARSRICTTHRLGEAEDQPVEQVLHRRLGKRLEVDRGADSGSRRPRSAGDRGAPGGRASSRTAASSGTSSRYSTKSSSAVSAHCTSSKTIATG